MRLQQTLQGLVLVVCLVVLAAGSGLYYLFEYFNQRVIEQRTQLLAQHQAADINNQLLHYQSRLHELASHPALQQVAGHSEHLSARLEALCPENYCHAYLLSLQGRLLAEGHSDEHEARLRAVYRPFFVEALAEGQAVSNTLDPVTRTSRFYLSERVDNQRGMPLGVLVLVLEAKSFTDSFEQLALPAVLLSPEGYVLASNRSNWVGQMLSSSPDHPESLGLVIEDPAHAAVNGRHFHFASTDVSGTPGWRLMVLEPENWPIDAVFPLRVWLIIAAVVFLLLALLSGFLLRTRWQAHKMVGQLAENQSRAECCAALNDVTDAALLAVREGCIVETNQAALRLFGYAREQLLLMRLPDLLTLADNAGEDACEVTGYHQDGSELALEVMVQPDGELQFLRVRDLAGQKAAERSAQRRAHYDGLTGLANRSLLLERLKERVEKARAEGGRIGLLFIDLDDFKKVNDSRGHVVGDQLLSMAAERLKDVCGQDAMLARYGGDEFVLLLENTSADAEKAMAERINQRLAQVFQIQHSRYFISASIGLASYPLDAADANALLQKADTAMYCAKADGGNTCCHYTPEMNRDITERLAIEQQLRGALENNEFSLSYQPIFETRSCRLAGAEALLRWHNPELGDVGPDTFIPLAEQTGLIEGIGNWVLHEVAAQIESWRMLGMGDLSVSVNVSPRQFRDQAILKSVQSVLEKCTFPPELLTLEVTEGVLMRRGGDTAATLHSLKQLGVRLSMDDFGTGYSSLSYLKRYPFDSLKIDREFIRDINEDHSDRQLIKAALSMARALGMRVVAEGIEDEIQLAFLRETGCDFVQGYLLSRPVPAQVFTERFISMDGLVMHR